MVPLHPEVGLETIYIFILGSQFLHKRAQGKGKKEAPEKSVGMRSEATGRSGDGMVPLHPEVGLGRKFAELSLDILFADFGDLPNAGLPALGC